MTTHSAIERIRHNGVAILPSLLLCDFGNLEREVQRLEEAGVSGLHLDVMDGVFVPNFTYGMPIVSALRRLTNLPLDVHLMISNPGNYVRAFVDAGADIISFHVEAVNDPIPLLREIQLLGAAAGIALNPRTQVESLGDCLAYCDAAVVMSVEAGFGGQAFDSRVLPKLAQIRSLAGGRIFLEVDGGVNQTTIARCLESGAEGLVVGSAIFGQPDYGRAIRQLNDTISPQLISAKRNKI